jgi:hypothetical protein
MHSVFRAAEYDSACRIVLGRSTGNVHAMSRPLLIDPVKETVQVAPYSLWGESELQRLATHRGQLYFQQYDSTAKRNALRRVAYPGDKLETLRLPTEEGWLVSSGDHLHQLGCAWHAIAPTSGEARRVATRTPWYFMNKLTGSAPTPLPSSTDVNLRAAFGSAHYGPLVIIQPSKGSSEVFGLAD